MIWWINCAVSTVVLILSVWAVLDPRVPTRLFGTVSFSCFGLFAALHMRKPGFPGFFSGESAVALSVIVLIISAWLFAHYQGKQRRSVNEERAR
jgi:hypothetical protein